MTIRRGEPSPRLDRGAMATEYGLMVTLISVLVGGLVAALGAHLLPDPCSLFQVCSPPESQRSDEGPGGPAPLPSDQVTATATPSSEQTASPTATASPEPSPSSSPSSVPCPSPSLADTPAAACPSVDPSATPTAAP